MTRSFLKILMAASALVPVAATAQRGPDPQAEGRGQWNGQRGGDRGGNRGGWNGARADRAQPAQQQAQPQVQAQPQAQPQVQYQRQAGRPQRGDLQNAAQGQRGGWQNGRPDRFAGRNDGPGRQDIQPDRDGRQDGRSYQGRGAQGFQGRPAQGGYDARQPYGRNDLDNRGSYQNRGQNRGQNWGQNRGYDTRQAYGRGSYANRGGYSNGGAWNRGWRSDNRYAWSDYRASNRGAYRLPRYYAPSGWGYGYRRFGVGFTLSSILFNQSYWIQDPYTYRLPEAYGPYRWVRYYNDALLVDLDSGQVVDTVYDIFW
ncbi:RcnB family protein [Sphingomonas sp. PB2P19]|uniref:RcnB family protein n=1 Tax=Sphingomonas rhamnosi TaxID=3096156 RepID=UPI002FC8C817